MLRFATAGFLYVLLTPIVEASTPHYSVNNPFNQSAPTTVVTPLNKMFYNPPKTPLGIPGKVLSQPYNGEYLMDPMLLHLRVNSRQSIAKRKRLQPKIQPTQITKQKPITRNKPFTTTHPGAST
ncbi:hypothetical protein [Xylella fastidiosa]|uniref:hypothetical protein n=1 Tax=Xylella fastidiosa TaxID=2371 RepID=UPI001E44E094|nr:hypothetical protein [Xylella fastidiosa]